MKSPTVLTVKLQLKSKLEQYVYFQVAPTVLRLIECLCNALIL